MKLVFNKKEMCLIAKKEDLSAFFMAMRLELEKGDPKILKQYWYNNQGICLITYQHVLCNVRCWEREYSQEIKTFIWDAVMPPLQEAFKTWPEYSGHPKWPINVKSSKKSSINQFKQLRHWKGKQLQARLSLLKHLEKHIEDIHIPISRRFINDLP